MYHLYTYCTFNNTMMMKRHCPCLVCSDMICTICTDRAEGYHFGAISCAACGAFFRRSISDQKVYSCATRNCKVIYAEKDKRGGTCRFCRFQKCMASGMQPQEVRAKRTSPNFNSPGLLRSVPTHTSAFIEQLVFLRRQVGVERAAKDVSIDCDLPSLLNFEFEIMQSVSDKCEVFAELQTNAFYPVGIGCLQNDIFLTYFLFESCLITCMNGGVQLDRIIFPNKSFIELSEAGIRTFLESQRTVSLLQPQDQSRVCFNTLSFLVQVIAKNLQVAHLDESFLSILFYVVLTQSAPPHTRNPTIDTKRNTLLDELSKIETTVRFPNFFLLVDQLLQARFYFKEFMNSLGHL